jgi:hypothetical protein
MNSTDFLSEPINFYLNMLIPEKLATTESVEFRRISADFLNSRCDIACTVCVSILDGCQVDCMSCSMLIVWAG